MSQEGLCRVSLLSLDEDIVSKLDYENYIAEFMAKKARKETDWPLSVQFMHGESTSFVRVIVQ